MPFETLYAAISLPIILMYLLMLLRIIERRQIPPEAKEGSNLVPLRDTALVTLSLDVTEIVQDFPSVLTDSNYTLPLFISTFLFVLHISVFLLAINKRQMLTQDSDRKDFSVSSAFLNIYLGLSLLMTNATTIGAAIQLVGRAS